ncbi:MAG TPA: right-handed parallel beta-helix repeat-containing protein [Rhodothermales bacterium]|nr:right-handed parallel beta-helix repeat-containing protein [Rhodothermales bacterium]
MRSDVLKAAAFFGGLIFLPGLVGPASAPIRATFTVNTTIDASDGDTEDGICDTGNADEGFTGLCTLRAAWQQADASAGADVIVFDLGAGIPTITLDSGLGDMTSTIDINGATGGATKVEIKGPGAGPEPGSDSGMLITAGGNTIKNLVMNGFDGSAIILSTEGGSTLEGNWIGIDKTGASAPNAAAGLLLDGSPMNTIGGTTEAARNVFDAVIFFDADANTFIGNYVGTTPDGSAATGMGGGLSFVFGAEDNVIGGPDPGKGNVISGNGGNGITISFGSTDNLIEGNFIGTNPTGSMAVGNAADGIHISGSSDNTFRGNLLSSNGSDGIELREGAAKTVVTGNRIGTDITGSVDLGNGEIGIRMVMAPENTIGGTTTETRNLISGNAAHGILIRGEVMEAPFPNTILGNRIGTNADGTAALPNGGYGVAFDTTPTHFLGSGAGAAPPACAGGCNLISGNTLGGVGLLPGATAIHVTGNLIGLTEDGSMPLPNGGPGINIMGGNENMVEGNVIAFNAGPGVRVVEDNVDPAVHNRISMNAIFENDGLGIDLGPPGITPNDAGDSDDGANDLQNTPTITSVTQESGSTTIEGFVKSTPSGTFRVELFANAMPDPSGAGEGQQFLGDVMVDKEEVFTLTVPGLHENIAATATDGMGNTSEFSGESGLIVNAEGDATDTDIGNGVCDTGGTILRDGNEEPECTLRAAIQEANALSGENEIKFDIPTAGKQVAVPTIRPTSPLPEIDDSVILNGASQPDSRVEIDGSEAGDTDGLHISAGNSTVNALVINRFMRSAIRLSGGGKNTLIGNRLGTNADGTAAAANTLHGLHIDGSAENIIGGTTETARNLISGNTQHGILISGNSPLANKIIGNYIGTNAGGTAALANDMDGLRVEAGNKQQIGGAATGERNVISGNGRAGVFLAVSGDAFIKILGNYIGTDKDGTAKVPNGDGVRMEDSRTNFIGGAAEGEGNVISGNSGSGVHLGTDARNNALLGNFIGTDKDGTGALGNGRHGVLMAGAPANHIGTDATQFRRQPNVISANDSSGVAVRGVEARANTIYGNLIGTDKNGTCPLTGTPPVCPLGNRQHGIHLKNAPVTTIGGTHRDADNLISGNKEHGILAEGASTTVLKVEGNLIGTMGDGKTALPNAKDGIRLEEVSNAIIGEERTGDNKDKGNLIFHNGGAGVVINGDTAQKNTIRLNTFFGNKGSSIDLGADGPTANDLGDGRRAEMDKDTGPNNKLNFPVGITASPDPANADVLIITGLVDTPSPETVRVDLYNASAVNANTLGKTRFGEGEMYLATVTPSAQGTFRHTLAKDDLKEPFLSGIVTDGEGATSEFSWVCFETDSNKNVDNDGDSLCDNWEIDGIDYDGDGTIDLNLKTIDPNKAASSGIKDIFVEIDYMKLSDAHNEEPHNDVLSDVVTAFKNAPIDGHAGIQLHLLKDEALTHKEVISFSRAGAGASPNDFNDYKLGDPVKPCGTDAKDGHFGTMNERRNAATCPKVLGARRLVFRYALFAHSYDDGLGAGSSGKAEGLAPQAGNDFLVTLGSWIFPDDSWIKFAGGTNNPVQARRHAESGTLMHEFGHTLGLRHGGADNTNCKPNYPSIMSYSLQMPAAATNRILDYARKPLRELNEAGLDEAKGLDGSDQRLVVYNQPRGGAPDVVRVVPANTMPIDWDGDGDSNDPSAVADINGIRLQKDGRTVTVCNGNGTSYTGQNDWAALIYNFRISPNFFGDGIERETTPPTEAPELTREQVEALAELVDFDEDGFSNAKDNCPGVTNPDQSDINGDGIGDACEGAMTDLVLSLTATPEQVMVGNDLTYTATIHNIGPDEALDVTLTDTLNARLTLTSSITSQGTCTDTDGVVDCLLGTIATGDSATVTILVQPTAAAMIANTVHVTSTIVDTNPASNQATVQTEVMVNTPTEDVADVPRTFALHGNFPNPFNPQTTIRFDVAQATFVRLRVFNAMGQQVATLVEGRYTPGTYEATFDASALPSGVYVYRIKAGHFQAMRTMVLLK